MNLNKNIQTKYTDFLLEWGTGLKPYLGFYRKELTSDTFDIWVENAYYDPKSGAIEFECECSTMNGELHEKELIIRIKKGGIFEHVPSPEIDEYLAQSGTTEELADLIKLVNRRPVAATVAEGAEDCTASEYEEKMSMEFMDDDEPTDMVDESLLYVADEHKA